MSNVLGIDPGKTIAESCIVRLADGQITHRGFSTVADEVHVAIIEWPYTIPGKGGPDIDSTIRTAAIIAERLRDMSVRVYVPPRIDLLRNIGYRDFTRGNRDTWLNNQLKAMGYTTGRGTLLNSTHARAAFCACLFGNEYPGLKRKRNGEMIPDGVFAVQHGLVAEREIPEKYLYKPEA